MNGARHHGFTLVEALVALTVLALALAVAAVSLVQTLRNERAAATRWAAIGLATTLAEELRALRPGGSTPVSLADEGGPDASCATAAPDCIAARLAAGRLDEWRAQVDHTLPRDTVAEVTTTDGAVPRYRISLSWPDGPGPDRGQLELEVAP